MDAAVRADLQRQLGEWQRRGAKPRLGTVTAISPNVQVALGGAGSSYTDVTVIGMQRVEVNDLVIAVVYGNDVFVLGKAAGPQARQAFSFSNGWRAYNGGAGVYGTPGYWKDSEGVVHLSGLLDKNGGSWVAGETVATLPAGYRPLYDEIFNPPVAPIAVSRVDVIAASGVVQLNAGGASNPVGFLSLSGITYRTF